MKKIFFIPLVFISFILIIFIICFSYYIYINRNYGFKFATLKNKINIEQKNNNISDWKIYKNNRYGFKFQYPGDWNVSPVVMSNISLMSLALRSPENQKCISRAQDNIEENKRIGKADTYSGDAFYSCNDIIIEIFDNNPISENSPINPKIGERFIGEKRAVEYRIGGYGSSYALVLDNGDYFIKLDFKNCNSDECINNGNLSAELEKVLNSFIFNN